jgi:hypothetical protein
MKYLHELFRESDPTLRYTHTTCLSTPALYESLSIPAHSTALFLGKNGTYWTEPL